MPFENFDVTPEQCALWAAKLHRMSEVFEGKNMVDEAKMFFFCAILAEEMVLRAEAQALMSPFPVTTGQA